MKIRNTDEGLFFEKIHSFEIRNPDGSLKRCWACAIICFFKGHVHAKFIKNGWACLYCRKAMETPIIRTE